MTDRPSRLRAFIARSVIVIRLGVAIPIGLISAFLIFGVFVLPIGYVSQMFSEQALHAYMSRVADAVVDFRENAERLPSKSELQDIAERMAAGEDDGGLVAIFLGTTQRVRHFYFPDRSSEFEDVLGPAPRDGFVIAFWRGEWSEAYASWNGRSTVETSWLKTGLGFASMGLFFAGASLFTGVLAWMLLPFAQRRSVKTSAKRAVGGLVKPKRVFGGRG